MEDQANEEILKREQKCASNKELLLNVEKMIKDIMEDAIISIKTKELHNRVAVGASQYKLSFSNSQVMQKVHAAPQK